MRGFASLANMSVRSFQRKSRRNSNAGCTEWLNERRAERILHEIRNTDKCIAEIAADYGFATPSYFTTFCKQYFRQTPTVLRRRSELLHSDSWGGRLSVAGPSVMDRTRETVEQ